MHRCNHFGKMEDNASLNKIFTDTSRPILSVNKAPTATAEYKKIPHKPTVPTQTSKASALD